jgi:hypothetical protein
MAASYSSPGPGGYETRDLEGALEGSVKRISLQAIFAGVVVAIALQLLLSMLGIGIGLGLVDPMSGGTPEAGSFGIGGGIWWLITTLVSVFAGGYVAAWLAGIAERFDGLLHGVVTWAVTLLITFYLLTSALGGIIGGAFSFLGGAASAAGNTVQAVAPQVAAATGITPDMIREQAQSYLQPSNPDPATMSAEDAQKAIARDIPKLLTGSNEQAGQARERIVAIMAAQLKISPEEAAKRFDEVQAEFNQTKDQTIDTAKSATEKTAGSASLVAIMAFVALLLGAGAAAWGGSMAAQRRVLIVRPAVRT